VPIRKQSLTSRHSAAVGRRQSVGYELYNFGRGHSVVFEVKLKMYFINYSANTTIYLFYYIKGCCVGVKDHHQAIS